MDIQEVIKLGLDRHIPKFAEFPDGKIINIGAGNKHISGAVSVDLPEYDADISPLPFEDNSVSGIHCYHFLEHVKYPVAVLFDMQRVLKSGGVINILTPYYTSQMQYHDFDHKNFFCEMTWQTLFHTPYYNKNKIDWKLKIGINIIVGIVERNLSLFTQLVKV